MTRPNVLLIVLHAARVHRFSCYGYHRQTTPHLDEFARERSTFLRAYSSGSETLPSHTSLFTGASPMRTRPRRTIPSTMAGSLRWRKCLAILNDYLVGSL